MVRMRLVNTRVNGLVEGGAVMVRPRLMLILLVPEMVRSDEDSPARMIEVVFWETVDPVAKV